MEHEPTDTPVPTSRRDSLKLAAARRFSMARAGAALCGALALTAVPASAADAGSVYLGQTPPGKTPELFAPGIISRPDTREHCLVFSPAGDELFFTRGRWPESRILHMQRSGDQWSAPEIARFVKNDWATQPAFSPDGRYLYFSSSRGKSDREYYSLWRCRKTGAGWSDPEPMIDMGGGRMMEFRPTVDRDGSVVFLYWDYGRQTGDLYVAKSSDDDLAEPVMLESPISTEFKEVRPTIAPLGEYLLFVSDRPEGLGQDDVYVCFKAEDGTWSAPQNLGADWNTPGVDDVPSISPDGRYWFFEKDGDIYWKEAPRLCHAVSLPGASD